MTSIASISDNLVNMSLNRGENLMNGVRTLKISRPHSDFFCKSCDRQKIEDQDPEFQMELCDLQINTLLALKTIFQLEYFWKFVTLDNHDSCQLSRLQMRMCFSQLKMFKLKQRKL